MTDKSLPVDENDSTIQKTIILDIEPRLQWDNANGYCGETALQCIGLYYGVWLSQSLIRDRNQGEFVLQKLSETDHRDPIQTLSILHFTFKEWDWKNSPEPQYRDFCQWMKRSIICKNPVMFGIFLPDMDYDDYDHIVPTVGIRYKTENEYDSDDVLIFYDLYEKTPFEKTFNEMEATRFSVNRKPNAETGCIPSQVDYGISFTGIKDEDGVTLPVRLSVSAWDEPNPAFCKKSVEMDATVTVFNLTVNNSYALLRYSSYKHVPTKGDASAFLRSHFSHKHVFIADDTTYVYKDIDKIPSKGSVYYRCIPMPYD